jgi:hypothetical protein
MQNFLEAMETGYSKYNNPYHNLVHATDVLQTTYHILKHTNLIVTKKKIKKTIKKCELNINLIIFRIG